MHIDPARLTRLLQALSQKKTERVAAKPAQAPAAGQKAAVVRDIKVLRTSLKRRLAALPEGEERERLAAAITIQEILAWEFGAGVVDHPEFHRIADSITAVMLQDARIAASLGQLLKELQS